MFDKKIHPIVLQWLGHLLWAGTRPAPAKRNQVRKIGEAEIFIIFQIRVRRKKENHYEPIERDLFFTRIKKI